MVNEDKTFYYLEKSSGQVNIADGRWSLYDWNLSMFCNDENMYDKVQKKWRVIQVGKTYRVLDRYRGVDLFSVDELDFKRINSDSILEAALIHYFKNKHLNRIIFHKIKSIFNSIWPCENGNSR